MGVHVGCARVCADYSADPFLGSLETGRMCVRRLLNTKDMTY